MYKRIVLLFLILVLMVYSGFNFCRSKFKKSEEKKNEEVIPVKVITAKVGELPKFVESTGNLFPSKQVKIFPKVPGKVIEKIFVDKGDTVKKGDLLATLEKKEIDAMIRQANAELAALESELKLTELDYNRILNLYKSNSVSKQKLDQVQTKLKSIKSKIDAAVAHIEYLKVLKDNHNVYATIDGIVVDRYLDSGSFSSNTIPILSINKEDELKLITHIPETYFSEIKKGQLVEFTVDAYNNRIFKGNVNIIYPTIDYKTRTFKVEIIVPNEKLVLRSGMFCNVKIYIGKEKGIVLPMDVLNRIPGTGSYFVYVVKDNRAYLRNVTTGISYKNNIILLSGVQENESVVVNGSNRLGDGKQVKIVGEM